METKLLQMSLSRKMLYVRKPPICDLGIFQNTTPVTNIHSIMQGRKVSFGEKMPSHITNEEILVEASPASSQMSELTQPLIGTPTKQASVPTISSTSYPTPQRGGAMTQHQLNVPSITPRDEKPPHSFTDVESQAIRNLLGEEHFQQINVCMFGATTLWGPGRCIGRADFCTLRPGTWLNDDIINMSFELIHA